MVTGAYFVPEPSVEQEPMFRCWAVLCCWAPGPMPIRRGLVHIVPGADGVTDSQGEPHRLGFAVHGPDPVEVPVVMKHGEPLRDRDRGDHDVR